MKQRKQRRATRPVQFIRNEVKYTAAQHDAALLLASDIPHYRLVGARDDDPNPICILVRAGEKQDEPVEGFWRTIGETNERMWMRVRLAAALMFAKFGKRPLIQFIYPDTPI